MHIPTPLQAALKQQTAQMPTDQIIEYEPCPLCGALAPINQREPKKGEEAGHVIVAPRSTAQPCKECQVMAARYPELVVWTRRVIAHHNMWHHLGAIDAAEQNGVKKSAAKKNGVNKRAIQRSQTRRRKTA